MPARQNKDLLQEIGSGKKVAVTPDNKIKIEDFEIIPPGRGQVLIKTISTLISAGTELGSLEVKRTENIYPGYSNAGVIVFVGEDVEGYKVGDRILTLAAHVNYVSVTVVPQAVSKIPDKPGFVSTLDNAVLKDLFRIPENVSFDEAAFGVVGGVAMNAIRKTKIELGEFVAITGMGLVGQLVLQLARHTGAESLIAIDLCPNRLALAKKLGADYILNPGKVDLKSEIDKITGKNGLAAIIETTGYPQLIPTAVDLARTGGRIILVGSIWNRKIAIDFMPFALKDISLISAHQPNCPTHKTMYFPWTQQYNRNQILKMVSDGRLKIKELITHRLPYQDAAEAYRLLKEEKDKSLGIILEWTKTQII